MSLRLPPTLDGTVAGNLLRDNVGTQVKPFKQVSVIVPGPRLEAASD